MTDATTPTHRRLLTPHTKHRRKIIVTVVGDSVGFRLERSSVTFYLDGEKLFNQAELKSAQATTGFNAGPCANPKKMRNV